MANLNKDSGTVLIVDHDPEIRSKCERILSARGFKVDIAANGQEGLYKFILLQPNMVVLNGALKGGLDGFRTCEALRQDPNGKHTPVIMIIDLNEDDVSHAYEVGATDFVTNPVNWRILANRASLILRGNQAFKKLRKSEVAMENAQRIARMGSWEWDLQAKEVDWSGEMVRILGLDRNTKPSFEALMKQIHPYDKPEMEKLLKDAFQSGRNFSHDHRIKRPDGEERHIHQQVEVTINSRGEPARIYGIFQDITDRVLSQQRIRYLAYYNSMSGLPNRQLFKETMYKTLEDCAKINQMTGIYFIDLDGFKKVNDTFGHAFGDKLILEAANRMQAFVSGLELVTNPIDRAITLAHAGGGSFLLLVSPFEHEFENNRLAPQMLSQLSQPYVLDQRELFITASIGIAVSPHDGKDIDTLMKCGERALYHAKSLGKNSFQMYSTDIKAGSVESLRLEYDLGKALSRGEMQLLFQPKLDLKTHRIVSVEALIRWNHPKYGVQGPGTFIPLAEENGLILQIGEWVIRQACEINKVWQQEGQPSISVAVNLSARQFLQQPIVNVVERALNESGLEPRFLEVEVTESLMMKNVDESIAVLEKLKEMGVRVAIDDFGTGYSSLSYLKRLPIDIIKIDRAFIKNIDVDTENQAITASILALCSRLGLKVVAEGVEERSHLQMLEEMECDIAQGYLIGRPMPPEEIPALLVLDPFIP